MGGTNINNTELQKGILIVLLFSNNRINKIYRKSNSMGALIFFEAHKRCGMYVKR